MSFSHKIEHETAAWTVDAGRVWFDHIPEVGDRLWLYEVTVARRSGTTRTEWELDDEPPTVMLSDGFVVRGGLGDLRYGKPRPVEVLRAQVADVWGTGEREGLIVERYAHSVTVVEAS